MRNHKFITASIMIALVCVAAAGIHSTATAQSCDYPVFIAGAVDVNVLILLDSSGSMTTAVFHDAYDDNTDYSGPWNRNDADFNVYSDGVYSPHDFDSAQPYTPTAPLVTSDMGRAGRYTRNYLNWVFFHATDAQRAALPQITRIEVARPAVNDIIDANPTVRFGVWKYNSEYGATLVAAPGTNHSTIKTAVSGIDAEGYTPLAEAMCDIYTYVRNNASSIQYSCQKTFLIVVTDGLPTRDDNQSKASWPGWTGDADSDGAWADDVARYMRTHDAKTDQTTYPGDQLVSTYAIGFNIDSYVIQDIAVEGGGAFYNATNSTQLVASLKAVLRDILNRIAAGSSVAVVSSESGSDDFLYRGKFLSGKWEGYLEAFALPYSDGDSPVWEAGSLLEARAPGARTVYTSVGGTQMDFTSSYASTLRPILGVATDTEAADLINWTRGEELSYLRNRDNWKLGDIIDSAPLVVGPPAGYNLYGDYLTWRIANQNRDRVIYVGANDAMIHCLSAETGDELWGYVPEAVLGRVADLADTSYCHEFFCNLTPKVFDAYLGGSWKTMMIAGLREGGDAYVALDVTDPYTPLVMWESTLPNISGSWSIPEIARPESWGEALAFVGSGPDETNGRAYLKAMDLNTGAEVYSVLLSDNGATEVNMATSARGVDLDYDGWTDQLYIGDLEGNLWRLDFNESPWDLSLLFQADTDQSIQAQPVLTVDYNDDVLVYFGTGHYLDAADLSDVSQQTFYSVIDKNDLATATRTDLVDETSSITPVGPTDRGWYIDLVERSGERVVSPSSLVAGIVYFTSFQPNADPCSAGGYSFLYKVDFRNGSADDNDDDESNDVVTGRMEDLGDGVGTRPVVDVANEDVIVQGSDTTIHVRDAVGTIRQLVVRSWRQRYN